MGLRDRMRNRARPIVARATHTYIHKERKEGETEEGREGGREGSPYHTSR